MTFHIYAPGTVVRARSRLSLQRSRVIPKGHQLVPVIMSLEMSRVRTPLTDAVGLGKTVEAGL